MGWTLQLSYKSYQWGTHPTSYTSFCKWSPWWTSQLWGKTECYLLILQSNEIILNTSRKKVTQSWLKYSISYVVMCLLREGIPKGLKGCLSLAPIYRIYCYGIFSMVSTFLRKSMRCDKRWKVLLLFFSSWSQNYEMTFVIITFSPQCIQVHFLA